VGESLTTEDIMDVLLAWFLLLALGAGVVTGAIALFLVFGILFRIILALTF
jgi:hypothetical protein